MEPLQYVHELKPHDRLVRATRLGSEWVVSIESGRQVVRDRRGREYFHEASRVFAVHSGRRFSKVTLNLIFDWLEENCTVVLPPTVWDFILGMDWD